MKGSAMLKCMLIALCLIRKKCYYCFVALVVQEWLWAGVCWLMEVTMTSLLHLYLTFSRSLHPLLATASSQRPCLATCDPWKPCKRRTMSHLLVAPPSVSYCLLNILFYSPVFIPPPLPPPVFLLTHTHVPTLPNPSTPKPYLPYLLSEAFYTSILHFLECSWHSWSFWKGLKWYQVELKLIQCFQNPSCHK